MQTKHAPGPWQLSGKRVTSISHGKHYTVAIVNNPHFVPECNAANARLIAASPDMAAALRDILAELNECGMSGVVRAQLTAHTAIAKATQAP